MGLEMLVFAVHQPSLETLLNMKWSSVYDGMTTGALRALRPEQDPQLTTLFNIDIEAEILDWMDRQHPQVDGPLSDILPTITEGDEGLLWLMKWSSFGAWEVWEARSFLYLESVLGRTVESLSAMYTAGLWDEVIELVEGKSAEEISEKIIATWMNARQKLGETLEEREDPKILPTFEAHTRAAHGLVALVNRICQLDDCYALIGREHLAATQWVYQGRMLIHFFNDS